MTVTSTAIAYKVSIAFERKRVYMQYVLFKCFFYHDNEIMYDMSLAFYHIISHSDLMIWDLRKSVIIQNYVKVISIKNKRLVMIHTSPKIMPSYPPTHTSLLFYCVGISINKTYYSGHQFFSS